jgi:hypothetical protein
MLLRTCPMCGDFYAEDAPPFCLADGTPLAEVDPRGESWAEGTRVVEEKTRLVRRRVRRLKLRRVLMTMTTVLITTMVVYVVASNYVVYLKPDPEAPTLLAAVTPSPSPTSPTPVPIPTPSPEPSPTPTPACTDEDMRDAEGLIVNGKNRERWHDVIEGERPAVIKRHVPPLPTPTREDIRRGEAELSPVVYKAAFSKDCTVATVTARYEWRVTWAVDGAPNREAKTVKGARKFECSKDGAAWRCP